METTIEKLAVITGKIATLDSTFNSLSASKLSWENDLAKVDCKGKIGKNKTDCENDRIFKQEKVAYYANLISANRSEKENLLLEQTSLKQQANAEAEATVVLASQGKSNDALIVEAKGRSEAEKVLASAQAESVIRTTQAATEQEAKKNKIFLYAGIGLAVVIVVVVVIMRKKRKK